MKTPARSNNRIANWQRIIKVLKDVGEAPPLGPLKPICGVALAILETIQDIRKFRGDLEDLAERIAELVLGVSQEIPDDPGCFTPDFERRLTTLMGTLEEIREYAHDLSTMKWYKAIRRTQELKDNMTQYSIRLDDARQLFNTTSLLSIQKVLRSNAETSSAELDRLVTKIQTRTDEIVTISQATRTEASLGFNNVLDKLDTLMCHGEFQVFRYDQIDMKRTIAKFSTGYVCRAEIPGSPRPARVIVKVFCPEDERQLDFKQEVKKMQKLVHPNLHRVLGISPTSSSSPFVVLSEYAHKDVYKFLDARLQQDKVTSFMTTLKILQGIASGLEFLRRLSTLSKDEIEECAKATNFVLTSDGQVVIGHNLLTTEWGSKSCQRRDRAASDSLGEWLKTVFYTLIVEFAYGSCRQDYTNWDWVMARGDDGRRKNRHLRYLQTFACYAVPTIRETSQHLDTLVEMLEDPWERHELTFPEIRQAVVRERGSAFVYRPRKAINASIGDLGYMDDNGCFQLLTNVMGQAMFEVHLRDVSGLTCNASYAEGTPDGSGRICHKFFNAYSASIRRQSESQCITDPRDAWRFLLANAVQLQGAYLSQHPKLEVEDLILVIGTQRDLRYMYLDRREDPEGLPSPDQIIEFVEYENPSPDRPWGYWVVEDGVGMEFTDWRCQENILFIQLENFDIAGPN